MHNDVVEHIFLIGLEGRRNRRGNESNTRCIRKALEELCFTSAKAML